ncbi:uncharacterized protein BDR25DRAFT_315730 [Lindgomyces ingoldianus]|uniref:Uncharacterized protein n=1 Tax=Lindgomyces ingoldianus TaxID=673940 RepID=A0ACB6QPF1_9PLEO|nr:uncharacterized protein BDR25DRAFT_315730 [Lindgomyces ingoldianus]KAF2468750.1 hypothetical protein BDR25DRAFT_315730 [Lindgomyces ingoldianus]
MILAITILLTTAAMATPLPEVADPAKNLTISDLTWRCNFHTMVYQYCTTENDRDFWMNTHATIPSINHGGDLIKSIGETGNLDVDGGHGGAVYRVHDVNGYDFTVIWRDGSIGYTYDIGGCWWDMHDKIDRSRCDHRAGCNLGDWTSGPLNCEKAKKWNHRVEGGCSSTSVVYKALLIFTLIILRTKGTWRLELGRLWIEIEISRNLNICPYT